MSDSDVTNPDALLIQACEHHTKNARVAQEQMQGEGFSLADMLAYDAAEKVITDTPARTMAGVLAKARAAQAEAAASPELDPIDTMAGVWAWAVLNELLAVQDAAAAEEAVA